MSPVLQSFLAGFPVFMLHSAVTLAIIAIGVTIYIWLTPYREFQLVRAGNMAASITLSAAILGIALPLAFCMAASVNLYDILLWGAVALVLQLIAFKVVDLMLRDLPKRIEAGETAPAVLLAAIKLAVAAVNAAALSG